MTGQALENDIGGHRARYPKKHSLNFHQVDKPYQIIQLEVSVLIDYYSLAFINLVLKNKGGWKDGLTTSFPWKKGSYQRGAFLKESEEGLREELRYMF